MLQEAMTGTDTVEGGQVVGLASPAEAARGQNVLGLDCSLLQAVRIHGVNIILFGLWL